MKSAVGPKVRELKTSSRLVDEISSAAIEKRRYRAAGLCVAVFDVLRVHSAGCHSEFLFRTG